VCVCVCVSMRVSYNDLEVKDDVISVDVNSSAFVTVDHSRLAEIGFAMQAITLYL